MSDRDDAEVERQAIARETIELTIEVRKGDLYEFWAMTDEFSHFSGATSGFRAIERALLHDPRLKIDSRNILTLSKVDVDTSQRLHREADI